MLPSKYYLGSIKVNSGASVVGNDDSGTTTERISGLPQKWGSRGQHRTDVCGEAAAVTRKHLLRLATEGGGAIPEAEAVIDRVTQQAGLFGQLATDFSIRRATVQRMQAEIERCRMVAAGG